MKFKKGDTVYAASLSGKIFKAKIKAVHTKTLPDIPYELDIKTKSRYYPADEIFATREEAEQGLAKSNLKEVEKALTHPGNLRMVQAVQPNDDGSYCGAGGVTIKPDFELSEEDKKELSDMAGKLDMWLAAHNIPYIMCIITAKEDQENGQSVGMRRTACFPGPRTPPWLRIFYGLLEEYLSSTSSDE